MKQTKFVSKSPLSAPFLISRGAVNLVRFRVSRRTLRKPIRRLIPRFPISRLGLKHHVSGVLILNKVSEWFAAGWVAEFTEGFGFDLADAFTGYVKDFTNIFKRAHFTII